MKSHSNKWAARQPSAGELAFEKRLESERQLYKAPKTYTTLYLEETGKFESNEEKLGISLNDK